MSRTVVQNRCCTVNSNSRIESVVEQLYRTVSCNSWFNGRSEQLWRIVIEQSYRNSDFNSRNWQSSNSLINSLSEQL